MTKCNKIIQKEENCQRNAVASWSAARVTGWWTVTAVTLHQHFAAREPAEEEQHFLCQKEEILRNISRWLGTGVQITNRKLGEETPPLSKDSGLYTWHWHREQHLTLAETTAMALFTRTIGLLRQTVNPRITNKAWASQKASNNSVSVKDQAIGLVVLFSVFLIPSGWVLAHMDHYKGRPE